tara:strand:- start:374 stop:715 length:342 start_codon:yes stop_codon:yes gene_type:complete
MNNPIDKMTGHFRTKISGDMGKVHVAEWEIDIYYKTANTLQEESKLIELAQAGKTVEALVETLITKARTADGSKMFKKADKVTMMNEVDPGVLIRVVGEMNDSEGNIEYAEKN